MAPLRTLVALACASAVSAFAPASPLAVKPAVRYDNFVYMIWRTWRHCPKLRL